MRTFRAVMVVVALAPIAQAQADLFNVVRFGTLDEVTEALEGVTGLTDMVDSYGQDLLVYAANSNPDPEVIRYLVSLGFNVNVVTPERWTPLMYAVRFNPEPLIALALLELGANPTVANSAGQTAADLVADNPNPNYSTPSLLSRLSPPPPVAPAAPTRPPVQTRNCCRYCSTGQACGDSCISRSNTCRRGAGCACNAVVPQQEIIVTARAGLYRIDQAVAVASADCPVIVSAPWWFPHLSAA